MVDGMRSKGIQVQCGGDGRWGARQKVCGGVLGCYGDLHGGWQAILFLCMSFYCTV
jgi:hypothetical protein